MNFLDGKIGGIDISSGEEGMKGRGSLLTDLTFQ